jgi:hypothetical protein
MNILFLLATCQLGGGASAFAQSTSHAPDLAAIRRILELPADQLDLARAKLTIDQMMDPKIDIDEEIQRIESMVEGVKSIIPAGANALQKVAALRLYLHEPGPWNAHRAFGYDFDDPLGKRITKSSGIETQLPFLVSMYVGSSLFAIVLPIGSSKS